jgi:DNA-binding cell septation regulator SpoVG
MPQNTKPAVVNGGPHDMIATNWKAFTKNTLQGFFTLTLPSGIVIHNCSLHRKNKGRWVGLPAQKYQKADGNTGFTPVIEFANAEARESFQSAALDAVDRMYLDSFGGRANFLDAAFGDSAGGVP